MNNINYNYINQLKKTQKKFFINIPNEIIVLYSKKKKTITFINKKNEKKSLRLQVQILPVYIKKKISSLIISEIPFSKVSTVTKKQLKAIKGTTVSTLKYLILELSVSFFCQKMRFIGVGYRALSVEEKSKNKLLYLRLGYSHKIYFQFLNDLNVFCLKFTKLFIFGNCYSNVTQTSAIIRSFRSPDPYKGKGVRYENEKIKLKIGKRA